VLAQLRAHQKGLIGFTPFHTFNETVNMSIVTKVYNTVFRRTSTFALACIVGAFGFERAFDMGSERLYENMNQGKLWKHIAHKYEEAAE